MADFSNQFRKVMMHYKYIAYNVNVMFQSAGLVINPITVNSFAALLNCTPVDQASDTMIAKTKSHPFEFIGIGAFICCLFHWCSNLSFANAKQ